MWEVQKLQKTADWHFHVELFVNVCFQVNGIKRIVLEVTAHEQQDSLWTQRIQFCRLVPQADHGHT